MAVRQLRPAAIPEPIAAPAALPDPVVQSYWMLRLLYTAAPFLLGLDKFFNVLTNWEDYLAPVIPQTIHVSAATFMRGVGAIEMVAGILVAIAPRYFGYLVMAWLWLIVANLLLKGEYLDVAVRDLGLSLGALTLARLAMVVHRARAHEA
ncbi:MAG TPA: hypothetical protein VKE23_01625 [Candidatus Limnocylindria bacterium]|nr:hypothetical protein [Candidatus Limnocylindria bacterium]